MVVKAASQRMESVGGGTGRRRIADGGLCQRAWLGMNQRGSRGARMSRLDEDDESLVAWSRWCVYRADSRMSGARDLADKRDTVDVRNADLGNPKCNNGPDPR